LPDGRGTLLLRLAFDDDGDEYERGDAE